MRPRNLSLEQQIWFICSKIQTRHIDSDYYEFKDRFLELLFSEFFSNIIHNKTEIPDHFAEKPMEGFESTSKYRIVRKLFLGTTDMLRNHNNYKYHPDFGRIFNQETRYLYASAFCTDDMMESITDMMVIENIAVSFYKSDLTSFQQYEIGKNEFYIADFDEALYHGLKYFYKNNSKSSKEYVNWLKELCFEGDHLSNRYRYVSISEEWIEKEFTPKLELLEKAKKKEFINGLNYLYENDSELLKCLDGTFFLSRPKQLRKLISDYIEELYNIEVRKFLRLLNRSSVPDQLLQLKRTELMQKFAKDQVFNQDYWEDCLDMRSSLDVDCSSSLYEIYNLCWKGAEAKLLEFALNYTNGQGGIYETNWTNKEFSILASFLDQIGLFESQADASKFLAKSFLRVDGRGNEAKPSPINNTSIQAKQPEIAKARQLAKLFEKFTSVNKEK